MTGGRTDSTERTLAAWEARSSHDRSYQAGSGWFLPSGIGLMEVALRAGFVAPVLLGELDEEAGVRYNTGSQMAGFGEGGSK